jgi:hypothetical protein
VLFFLKKGSGMHTVTQYLVGEEGGGGLVTPMLGENILECHSGLRPSKKELPECLSGVFHHKNALTFMEPKDFIIVST